MLIIRFLLPVVWRSVKCIDGRTRAGRGRHSFAPLRLDRFATVQTLPSVSMRRRMFGKSAIIGVLLRDERQRFSGRRTSVGLTSDSFDMRCHRADPFDHRLIDISCNSTALAFMTKALQFDFYGGLDVLEVRDVPRPVPDGWCT
jgi:hypothetical protein